MRRTKSSIVTLLWKWVSEKTMILAQSGTSPNSCRMLTGHKLLPILPDVLSVTLMFHSFPPRNRGGMQTFALICPYQAVHWKSDLGHLRLLCFFFLPNKGLNIGAQSVYSRRRSSVFLTLKPRHTKDTEPFFHLFSLLSCIYLSFLSSVSVQSLVPLLVLAGVFSAPSVQVLNL